jgi:hypothetical protein
MARDEAMKMRRGRSGAKASKAIAIGKNTRSQLIPRCSLVGLIYCMILEVASDSGLNRRKEVSFPDQGKQSKAFKLVLYRIL